MRAVVVNNRNGQGKTDVGYSLVCTKLMWLPDRLSYPHFIQLQMIIPIELGSLSFKTVYPTQSSINAFERFFFMLSDVLNLHQLISPL